ncbi:ATP phosphoribosyltransferase regulatory subunit [Sulfitobacter sp. HNIBRBA3233]|uniref:ATP phosphoribosyltransferase regulatory subunit n=1 Tax=Sulfitobacter marinivivus TaxID=3158558 RepID=UPI0032DE9AEB
MPTRAQTNARAAELRARFEAAGAQPVEPPILQPAGTLLDLYGEDIRARAYVTSDALRGEQMLRPDFTVPVVQMHMQGGAEPARYTYAGEVFRRQEEDEDRASEYVQVGYEVFERADPAASDAEVFALIAAGFGDLPVRAMTGDIGVLMAVVDGLATTEMRKAALRRHIWRPRRFRALLEMYAGRTPPPPQRDALLAGQVSSDAPLVGLRSQREIDARIAVLRADREAPALADREVALIEALLDIAAPLSEAIGMLEDLAVDLPAIEAAVGRVKARAQALEARDVDVSTLMFEASYGRSSMEYYDGFVFGFRAEARPDLPPLATGGRYDALTRRLGGGAEIPAVGGVMRPGLILEVEGC